MADTEDGTSALIKTEREEPDTDEQTQPETRKISRRITVEPLLVFYFMAFAPSVPLYEQYVYQQIPERHNFSVEKNDTSVCYIDTNSTEYKREQIVQSESSHWLMYFTVASIIPTTLVMVLIGPYTDQRGRKIAMYAPLIGAIGKLILTTTIVGLHLPFELILVGCVIDGLSGGIVAFVMACFAYIAVADITTVTRRAIRIFLLEVAIGVGVVLSDVGIGYAIKLLGYFYRFLILLSINVLNLLYTHFAVEESIIKKDNVKFFTAKHVKQTLLLYTKNDDTNRRWKIWIVMVILLLIGCIDFGNTDIQTYKLLKTPLCFTSVLVGYFTAANYAIKICIGVLFLKLTFRYLKEVWIIILACSSAAAFNFIFPFATTRLFAFLCEYYWWLVRVTLVVDWRFLPRNFCALVGDLQRPFAVL